MKTIIFSILIFFIVTQANASLITYNFSGQLTSISDPDSLLLPDRNFKTGDIFQAIYTIEKDSSITSGTIGAGSSTQSTYTSAITNFQFYVNNTNLIDNYYRFQTLRNINGYINGKSADWIEITTDGGLDNYNDSYGENVYGEYIDSRLNLVDLTGTALDEYNKTIEGNIPLTFNLNDFSFGSIAVVGQSVIDLTQKYQLRGEIDSFSNEGYAPVPEPSSVLLLGSGLGGLAWYQRRRKKK